MLTKEQKAHLSYILSEALSRIDTKYQNGAKEHGGLLSDLSEEQLLENAIDEAVDQVVYLLTLKQKFNSRV